MRHYVPLNSKNYRNFNRFRMKKITNSLIFMLLFCNHLSSQNIYSALTHNKAVDVRANSKISEITTYTKSFNNSGTIEQKTVSTINNKNKLISESRYNDEDKLTARLTFYYDETGLKSTSRKFENWHPMLGYTSEFAYYEYDKDGYLIKITDRNQDSIIIRETFLRNNDKGYPIELKLKYNNSNSLGHEVAEYDYENNEVNTKLLDETGKVISSSHFPLDYTVKDKVNTQFNDFGDIVKSNDTEYEYKYDKFSNWTLRTTYKTDNSKRKKTQLTQRTLKY